MGGIEIKDLETCITDKQTVNSIYVEFEDAMKNLEGFDYNATMKSFEEIGDLISKIPEVLKDCKLQKDIVYKLETITKEL